MLSRFIHVGACVSISFFGGIMSHCVDIGVFLHEPTAYLWNSVSYPCLTISFSLVGHLFPFLSSSSLILASGLWNHCLVHLQICSALDPDSHFLIQLTGTKFAPQRSLPWPHQSKVVQIHNLTIQSYHLISNYYMKLSSVCTLMSVSPTKIKVQCKLWLCLEQSLTCRRRSISICWVNKWKRSPV